MPYEPRLVSQTAGEALPHRQDELPYRRRQQALLREFGTAALQTRDFRHILQQAAELSARGLGCSYAKVLEYLPDEKRLIVRAGIGWPSGTVDHVSLGADIQSPAGFAFQTGQSVVSNHLQEETRFRTPKLLAEHGIKRAINVLIRRGGEGDTPFGVLEADSPDPGQFDDADADFLAGFAGLLGIAIERQHADAKLQEALDHEALLTREMSHRVKNSLTSVVGLLRVQARSSESTDVKNALENAAMRVASIAEVHDHLWRGSKVGFVDLSDFVGHLCKSCRVRHRNILFSVVPTPLRYLPTRPFLWACWSTSSSQTPSNMPMSMDPVRSRWMPGRSTDICLWRSLMKAPGYLMDLTSTSRGRASVSGLSPAWSGS